MRLDAKKNQSVEEKSSQTKQQLWKLVVHIHRGGMQQSRKTWSMARILSSRVLHCILFVNLYTESIL